MNRLLWFTASALVLILSFGCKAQPHHTAERMPDKKEQVILVGTASIDSLLAPPFGKSFRAGYDTYEPENETTQKLKKLLKDVHITTYVGTWCKDSKREVPRLVKILEAADYPTDEVEVIAMTRDKTTPQQYEAGMDIFTVPTFVFYKDEEELGRIVELPVISLESDMLKILSGQPYKHAYDWD